ncbi:response regulator [Candidatus Saccharibacteria bacterium]|nr:response regulator [Candidatus Saccharibacteria bacterium]
MSKILIVEDNPVINQMYRIKLEANGYNVTVATTGKEALELTKKLTPDLILLDIMMPEMNGDECLEILRRDKKFAETPVIVLTNMNNDAIVEKFETLGVDSFLLKSELTPKQVLEHVDKCLKGAKKEKKDD